MAKLVFLLQAMGFLHMPYAALSGYVGDTFGKSSMGLLGHMHKQLSGKDVENSLFLVWLICTYGNYRCSFFCYFVDGYLWFIV